MEYKYLKVEVSRTEWTDVYIKVPQNFNRANLTTEIVSRAVMQTIKDDDWDNYGWQDTIERQGIKEVSSKEAKLYKFFNLETGE